MPRASFQQIITNAINLLKDNWRILFAIELLSYIISKCFDYANYVSNSRLISVIFSFSSSVINTLLFILIILVIKDTYSNKKVDIKRKFHART